MAQSARGLGRGLDALLGGFSEDKIAPEVMLLPVDAIRANPDQPRREFSEEALAELTKSVKDQGVLQPILVRPLPAGADGDYEIVAGERRWRASRQAGLEQIPALIREVTDEQSLALALIENLQREDLSPMEQANGLHQLLTRFGLTQEDLAERVGMSRSHVANTLRLLQLSPDVQADLGSGVLSPGHARALLSVADETARSELWARVKADGLSVREAEDLAGHFKRHGVFPEGRPATAAARAPGAPRRKTPVDARLGRVRDLLAQDFGLRVNVAGAADKGRITFHFNAESELREILLRWGLALPEDAE